MNDRSVSVSELREADLDHSVEELLRLFSDPSVRATIRWLYERPDTTIDELASVIVAEQAADEATIATESEYERERIRLHHVVLPRLDDHDMITYEYDSGTVTETDIHEAIRSFLGVDTDERPS
ncbi:hypothetical protein EA462_07475 [Natrarchaeobius halalkaliphilus]|uniref:DUF7344 domain-containing protein n=1 Tax=Natrarchaeobius halalkaliphilus TaxID=1679091 RepID=A0A3N6LLS5_9EURY|nr:hypothetical protein [Natrarchaeobius halalkaliphilus]RQG89848.1 hypothetical protein EA462_07475 [Natrarchaeobius halalkaliphilus]